MKKFISLCIAAFLVAGLLFSSAAKTSAAKPEPNSAVSYTAPLSLYWLAKSGVPEAVEYVQYIDAEKILKPENIPHYERVERINKIYHEIRYASLNDFIDTEKYTNVMDLGCGVSPRCLKMARQGINYVGTDLSDVVEVLNFYAPNFIKDDMRKYVRFETADAADPVEMMNAAKSLNGKICIVEDGLLMYLPRDKQKAMLENIRDILKEHGGVFVTSDFVAGEIFMGINRTIYGEDDAPVVGKETQKLYEDLSEVFFNDTVFKTTDEAVKFIEEAGLKVEMRPLFNGNPNVRSIRDLNTRDIESINVLMKQEFLWVMTAD
ncbi:MAG: hypothetical protein IJ685_02680 [Selenomonadaceae bacterium]|nr:hypothetical protein [Selenomonadaceae bacterium]